MAWMGYWCPLLSYDSVIGLWDLDGTQWLSNGVDTVLETIFAWWGLKVASKWGIPISIAIMVIVFLACASGLIFDYKEENNGDKLFTPQDSQV